jgi:hypothetical protein
METFVYHAVIDSRSIVKGLQAPVFLFRQIKTVIFTVPSDKRQDIYYQQRYLAGTLRTKRKTVIYRTDSNSLVPAGIDDDYSIYIDEGSLTNVY